MFIADAQVELAVAADPMTGAIAAGELIARYLGCAGTASDPAGAVAGRRIDAALVSGCATEMIYDPDVALHHRHVTAAIRQAGDRLVGAMTLNPMLDLELSLAELRRLVAGERFRAVRLAPGIHGYLPHRCGDVLGAVCEEAAGLRIPVLISGGNPPYATPVLFADLAAAHPRTSLVLCGLGSDRVSYVEEAIYVALRHRNVMVTTAGSTLPGLHQAFAALGPERLVFGSGLPAHDPWSQLRMIGTLGEPPPLGVAATPEELAALYGANLQRLLRV